MENALYGDKSRQNYVVTKSLSLVARDVLKNVTGSEAGQGEPVVTEWTDGGYTSYCSHCSYTCHTEEELCEVILASHWSRPEY